MSWEERSSQEPEPVLDVAGEDEGTEGAGDLPEERVEVQRLGDRPVLEVGPGRAGAQEEGADECLLARPVEAREPGQVE